MVLGACGTNLLKEFWRLGREPCTNYSDWNEDIALFYKIVREKTCMDCCWDLTVR